MAETETLLASEDNGKDVSSVNNLLKKHHVSLSSIFGFIFIFLFFFSLIFFLNIKIISFSRHKFKKNEIYQGVKYKVCKTKNKQPINWNFRLIQSK